MRYVFAIAALIFATASSAQDHLTPTFGHSEHDARLKIVLREAYAPDVILGASFHPSFYPERAVALRRAGSRWEIVAVQSTISVWGYEGLSTHRAWAKSATDENNRKQIEEEIALYEKRLPARLEDVQRETCITLVDARSAKGIQDAWANMLRDVHDDPEDELFMDGMRYSFFLRKQGIEVSGDARSGDLADLASAMSDYCFAKESKDLRKVRRLSNLILQRSSSSSKQP